MASKQERQKQQLNELRALAARHAASNWVCGTCGATPLTSRGPFARLLFVDEDTGEPCPECKAKLDRLGVEFFVFAWPDGIPSDD